MATRPNDLDYPFPSQLLHDHVELLAVPAGGVELGLPAQPGDDVGERGGGGRGRSLLEQGTHEAALGGLVEVADDLALVADLLEDPDRGDAARRSGPGRQNEAYVVERRSITSPVPAASRATGSSTPRQWADTTPRPGRFTSPESR